MNDYTYEGQLKVEDRAYAADVAYLEAQPLTHMVRDVRDMPCFQRADIDIVWYQRREALIWGTKIEVKGDTYPDVNFFIETVSNVAKGTPGCFMYTLCKELHYVFVNVGRIYSIAMPTARDWFIEHEEEFPEHNVTTEYAPGEYYLSKGRTVPVALWTEIGLAALIHDNGGPFS